MKKKPTEDNRLNAHVTTLESEISSSKNVSEYLGIYMHDLRKIQLLFERPHGQRMETSIG